MSRLGQVWQLTLSGGWAVYVIVEEREEGCGCLGRVIETPPSCEYLIGYVVMLPEVWFQGEGAARGVSRLA